MADNNKTLVGHLKSLGSLFQGYNEDDQNNQHFYEAGQLAGGQSDLSTLTNIAKREKDQVGSEEKLLDTQTLKTRSEQYQAYDLMGDDPVLSCALDIHLSHALSSKGETGEIFDIVVTDPTPENEKIVAELKDDLTELIQPRLIEWGRIMAQYGVNYIRPYGSPKVGLEYIEHNWYTMPHHIREYERGGLLAGFTNEHFQDQEHGRSQLINPWDLVAYKIPHFKPKIFNRPVHQNMAEYSLFKNDILERDPFETQNYGTSFLENSWSSYLDLKEAVEALKVARRNSSKLDRVIGVRTGDLDPIQAGNYVNMIAGQMKKDADEHARDQKTRGYISSVWNTIVPILSGDKGGIQFDTQVGDANIQHIEDILFHLKRLSATVAIDVSLLGWSDMQAGGLGEGGWLRTAIQATIRADWIRQATTNMVNRLIDIHLSYKYGKAFVGSQRPYKIVFNSMNSALEREEMEAKGQRIDQATAIITLIDTIAQGSLGKSKAGYQYFLNDYLKMEESTAEALINDLTKAATNMGEQNGMFESLNDVNNKNIIRDMVIDVITNELS